MGIRVRSMDGGLTLGRGFGFWDEELGVWSNAGVGSKDAKII